MALQLSSHPGMPPGPITVVGDNLGVVRYCAATAGSQNTELHNILDDPLTEAACGGRRCTAW
eukprot:4106570-Lingulodinium_polyedra.AAC.1